jgi:hypothetical protein
METSKQTKEDAKEWCSRFEPYQAQVEDLSQKLKFLRYDHELMLKGYRFRYIIDSYDILKHVFPFKEENSPWLTNQSPEDVYRRLVREQIALGFIFHGLANSLILIPPYLLEIHDFLEFQRRRVRETTVAMMTMGLERYGRQLREVIENSGVLGEKRFQSIDELIQDLIFSFDKDTILNLAADHYKDLLALLQLNLSEMQVEGSALLVKLIQKKRLAPPEYVLDGFALNEKDLNMYYPQRKAALLDFQASDQSAEAAINDIVALEYIRQMNEHGTTANRKEIVLFIGSSVPMLKTLEKEGTFGMAILPEGYNFARCPEFWLAFLMLRKGMFYKESQAFYEVKACEETLDEIEAVSDSIKMFQNAIEVFAEVEKTGLITEEASDYFERAGSILEKVRSKLNSWENLRLILNERILPNLVSKTTEHGNKVLKSLADFLQSLHDTVTPF